MVKVPSEYQERFAALVQKLSQEPGVAYSEPKQTYGRSAMRFNQKIFTMISASGKFAVKLPRTRVDELAASGIGTRLEFNHGHLMKEWLAVSGDVDEEWLQLAQEALAYCQEPPGTRVRTPVVRRSLQRAAVWERLPAPFTSTPTTASRTLEFFTHHIRNPHTRRTYAYSTMDFAVWCGNTGLHELSELEPAHIAAYVRHLQGRLSAPSVKLNLIALRVLFDWLVAGQTMSNNPVSSVGDR